jgi:hypothetical protein
MEAYRIKRVHTHILRGRVVLNHALTCLRDCPGVNDENMVANDYFKRLQRITKVLGELEREVMQHVESLWQKEQVDR